MNYLEAVELLQQARGEHPEALLSGLAQSMTAREYEGKAVVEMGFRPGTMRAARQVLDMDPAPVSEALAASFRARPPIPFAYRHADEAREADISFVKAGPSRMSARPTHAGEAARGGALSPHQSGTVGWNLFLNGQPVALSCWHVLCGRQNQTQIGDPVVVAGGGPAEVFAYRRVERDGENRSDLALARYGDPDHALAAFRGCGGGQGRTYPSRIAAAESVQVGRNGNGGDACFTVGARQPHCVDGRVTGVRDVRVGTGFGYSAVFLEQLVFSGRTERGDSGSLLVRQEADGTSSALGVVFARDEGTGETLVTPLVDLGWTEDRPPRPGRDGLQVPAFQADLDGWRRAGG